MKTFAITDTGYKRNINQDYYYCGESAVGVFKNMFIVADGMGGHNAGDVASRFCIEDFIHKVSNSTAKTNIAKIEAALSETNEALIKKSFQDDKYNGMGTTFVFATVDDDTVLAANIGDSRLYLINREKIIQITHDHSLVEEMIRNGEIRREEARYHPNKNVITRVLGGSHHIETDFFEVAVEQDDVIMLCSDGLTNMVEDGDIYAIIRENAKNLEACGNLLVERANENGGLDNITIILILI